MCTTCGCGSGQMRFAGRGSKKSRPGAGLHYRAHKSGMKTSEAGLPAHADGTLDFGAGAAGSHAPGISQARMVRIERDILAKNNDYARENRDDFTVRAIFALNLVSSPGSGKTSLLVKTIAALKDAMPIAVIEGDQQTDNDAARIRAAGVPALQINTGKGCHLDAHMVARAVQRLDMQRGSLLLIENVGNLVCPAGFDLGEAHKVVILSVTEGEDKPLKYPDMFRAAGLMLLNKCDLLPYLEFDVELAIGYARRINPELKVICISAVSGEGMTQWLEWIENGCRYVQTVQQSNAEPKALLG